MPKLTVTYSKSLLELINKDSVSIDGVEVGPRLRPDEINQIRQSLQHFPFYFHAGNVVSWIKLSKKGISEIEGYLVSTQSPWVSIHIELLPWHVYLLSTYFGLNFSPPNGKQAAIQLADTLNELTGHFNLPFILENMPSLPHEKYRYAASPELITEIVNDTDSGFLLDIAHAKIAASNKKQTVKSYIQSLPLDRLEQIHISGVRMKNGRPYDAHESLEENDYEILNWVLRRYTPKVVTLEYFKEKDALREQLLKLREIVAG